MTDGAGEGRLGRRSPLEQPQHLALDVGGDGALEHALGQAHGDVDGVGLSGVAADGFVTLEIEQDLGGGDAGAQRGVQIKSVRVLQFHVGFEGRVPGDPAALAGPGGLVERPGRAGRDFC